MKTIKYWIEPKKSQWSLTHEEQVKRMTEVFRMYESVCKIRFVKSIDQFPTNLRFYFRNNAYMKREGGTNKIPFGLALKSGAILLNSERQANYWSPNNWTIQNLVAHEIWHTFPRRMWYELDHGHSGDRTNIACGDLKAKWLNPTNVLDLQGWLGSTDEIFYPRGRSLIGRQIREINNELPELQKERLLLIEKRNSLTNKIERWEAQEEVLDNLREIDISKRKVGKLSAQWREVNNTWLAVPWAGRAA